MLITERNRRAARAEPDATFGAISTRFTFASDRVVGFGLGGVPAPRSSLTAVRVVGLVSGGVPAPRSSLSRLLPPVLASLGAVNRREKPRARSLSLSRSSGRVRAYSGIVVPEPPISFGKSFCFTRPSWRRRTVSP